MGETWGYSVETGGVGRAAEKDEWGRDEALGDATQVAAFKRRDSEGWDQRRRIQFEHTQEILGSVQGQHKLLAAHRHIAHEKASQPLGLAERGEVVKRTLTDLRFSAMTLGDLWWEERVAAACGGWMELLAAAIVHHEELQLDPCKELPMSEWTVQLKNGLPEDDLPLDKEAVETYNMADGSLSSSDSEESSELVTPEENMQQPGGQLWDDLPQCPSDPTSAWPLSDGDGAWGIGDDHEQSWDAKADPSNAWTSDFETGATGW